MPTELWTEAYRPQSVKDYVFRDETQRNQVETWVKDQSIPHLLLSGQAGIGKTTLAKVLVNELGVEDLDFLEINASRTNSVEHVRDTIVNFVQMIPFGDFKVVLLDEADYLSPNAQAALRGVMEQYHDFARFILTCNYPNRIIHALHSRCQGFHLATIDQEEFAARVGQILLNEGVTPDPEILDKYIKMTYPDLRKCVNMVQMGVKDNELLPPSEGDSGEADWMPEMVDLFKQGKIQDARQLLCGKVRPEEMESVYRWIYDNINLFGDTDEKQDQAILIVKQGLTDHTLVADPEINLTATLIKLARNYEK